MPSVYQMLPPRNLPVFVDLEGESLDLDLYDPGTWADQGWSVFSPKVQARLRRKLVGSRGDPEALDRHNREMVAFLGRMLRRAERFRAALDAPVGDAAGPAYHAFGSDCVRTLRAAAVYQGGRGRQEILFSHEGHPSKEVGERLADFLYGPGDGLVLMESLLDMSRESRPGEPPTAAGKLDLDSAFFVCQSHGILPNDPIFQNNLFYTLLWAENRPDPSGAAPWATTADRRTGPTRTTD